MTAVVAAILAASLAGAIALYRERRIEARRLRVAARITEATIALAARGTRVTTEGESWDALDEAPGKQTFERVWEAHRDILAGHLQRNDWNSVQGGASNYLLYFFVTRTGPPNKLPAKKGLEGLVEDLDKARAALLPFCD
ncbi:MAG TPA: hypothetical protein VIP57_18860 [Candidatus Dormibacteraeota bacterium]